MTLVETTAALARHPDALVLAGGTDAMVEINDGRRRAEHVVAVNRVAELRSWVRDPAASTLTIGACVTYAELMQEPIASMVPALAEASRTVGSPQIRHAGTLGGNLGTCSPAGDGLPVLSALDAVVELVSATGSRRMPMHDFMLGVKRTDRRPDELITSITVPVVRGWQGYAKVGVRNAMVIATASACLVVDAAARTARLALGSVGPTVLRCPEAEAFAASAVDWDASAVAVDVARRFGDLAAAAARPIDDHRSSAAYRRHAIGVLARRLLQRAFPA